MSPWEESFVNSSKEIAILSPSRQPPLDELGWRNLLQHLLTLRSRVFTCVDQPTCYKVHRGACCNIEKLYTGVYFFNRHMHLLACTIWILRRTGVNWWLYYIQWCWCFDILQIFTESLLCSGREANIHLASQVLTLTPSLSHSTKQLGEEQRFSQGFTYCLPCEPSIQLVLNAAQEYFNSASGFMDKDMDLARLGIYVSNKSA